MPTYVYKCKKCGKVFEYSQRITEDALSTCPKELCDQDIKGMGEVERQISKNIGLMFSGSGFYLTDYANKHTSSSAAKESAPPASSSCCGCSGADSCSASTSKSA